MAKVLVELDTEMKTLSVSIDGKVIENVNSVSIYQYESEYKNEDDKIDCSIYTSVEDENDIKTRTSYYLECSEKAREISQAGLSIASEHAGFIKTAEKSSVVCKDVAAYLAR